MEKLHQAERKNSINLPWNTMAAEKKKISITPPTSQGWNKKTLSSTYIQEQYVQMKQMIKYSENFMNLQGTWYIPYGFLSDHQVTPSR